ncbi:MAG: hypothetical protein ABIV26_08675 [Candidatus Limnocylindrales bacterium]
MTRERDIEHVLVEWFGDGPAVMPDRAMARTFDEIDRTPQRRLASLLVRFSSMSRTVQLGLAAAAMVVVAVVGLSMFRPTPVPGAVPSIQPTASPAPSSSAPAAGEVPAAVVGRWMGGARDVPGIDADAGTSLWFTPGSFAITQANHGQVFKLPGDAKSSDSGHLRITATTEVSDCPLGAIGEYGWSLSPGGRILTFDTDLSDPCVPRRAAIAGTWWKMGCPASEDFCLGDLEPGRYDSQYVDPFLAAGATWVPRFGRLSYQVPAGWANVADWPTSFTLAPQGAPADVGITIWTDVAIVSEQDPCSETPATNVGQTAKAMTDWLASATGLVASTPKAVTIGGLSGWQLDVAMDPAWTTTCPFSSGKPVRGIFTDTVAGEGFEWSVGADAHLRLFVLDRGDGRAIVADIEAEAKANYDALVDRATTVVQSFEFTR